MKRIAILLFLILSNVLYSPAKGVWGIGTDHPGGNYTTNYYHEFYAYGDSIVVFLGERVMPKNINIFLRYTKDAGKTWQYIFDLNEFDKFFGEKMSNSDWQTSSMYFYPPSTIQIFQSNNARILTTTDWGVTWTQKKFSFLPPLTDKQSYALYSLDTMRQAIAYGGFTDATKYKYHITNNGWKTSDTMQRPVYMSFFVLNDDELLMDFGLTHYVSSNRGKTWDSVKVSIAGLDTLNKKVRMSRPIIVVPGTDKMFKVGSLNKELPGFSASNIVVWKSIDKGKTWKICLNTDDSTRGMINQMCMSPDGSGAVFGGYDLKPGPYSYSNPSYVTTDFGETWTNTQFKDSIRNTGSVYYCRSGSIKNMWVFLTPYLYKYFPDGISEVSTIPINDSDVLLYPNPVAKGSLINLRLNEDIDPKTSIKLYSYAGKLIDSFETLQSSTTISYQPDGGLVSGAYYFLIETLNKRIIKHFVVK